MRRSCKQLTLLMLLPARAANFELTATPSTKEAQAIADELYAGFVSEVRAPDPGVGACASGFEGDGWFWGRCVQQATHQVSWALLFFLAAGSRIVAAGHHRPGADLHKS